MPDRKKISAARRRHQDELRLKALKVGQVYEAKLVKARRQEVRRVLELARQFDDEGAVIVCLNGITERDYLPSWYRDLYVKAGMPYAESTARDMKVSKAGGFVESDVWLSTLADYAIRRAGENIVSVTGTFRDALIGLARRLMLEDKGLGVEKLTKKLYREYQETIEKWQCRRIAQTESMISTAVAAAAAADSLDIEYTKQWCTSGLDNVRETHEAMDGVIVEQNELFVLPGGVMRYPHDTLYNPEASEIINCACCCIREPK